MPAGQAHTTWFPELKDILKNKWNSNYSIEQHFSLVTDLNEKLRQIRKELNIQPPMMWCPNCQKRHRSRSHSSIGKRPPIKAYKIAA